MTDPLEAIAAHDCPALHKEDKEYMCFMTGKLCPYMFAKQDCDIFRQYIEPKEPQYRKSRELMEL